MIYRLLRNRFGKSREADKGAGGGSDRSGRRQGQGAGGGRGFGRGSKPGSGPGGNCVCPKCGHKEPHVAGKRCLDMTCPECGTKMVRE